MTDSKTNPPVSAELRQRLNNIYTPLEEAVAELRNPERRKLRSTLQDFLPSAPCCAASGGLAMQWRHLATPSLEMCRIRELAASVNLSLVFCEYHADKYVTRNPCKQSLGRMGFYSGRNCHDELILTYRNVVSNNASDGKPIKDIQTLWGQPLVEFHHELARAEWPDFPRDSFWDASDWYHERGCPSTYYEDFFSIFIAHGILFEVFLLDAIEVSFTCDVVLPAFYRVWERYGLKPLVVRSVPKESETDYRYWLSYSSRTKEYVEKKLGIKTRSHKS